MKVRYIYKLTPDWNEIINSIIYKLTPDWNEIINSIIYKLTPDWNESQHHPGSPVWEELYKY